MEEHLNKHTHAHQQPRYGSQSSSASSGGYQPITEVTSSLPEVTIPAPSLTTVMCRAGETETRANWVMVQHLTKPHLLSRAALAPAVLQHYQNVILMGTGHTRFFKRIRISILKNNQFPLEEDTLVPYWITVRSPAGVRDWTDNWVMVAQSTSLRLHQSVLSEQTVLPLPSLLEDLIPVPFSTTARFHAGGEGIMANWAMVKHPTNTRPPSRAVSVQDVPLLHSLLEQPIPVLFSIMV